MFLFDLPTPVLEQSLFTFTKKADIIHVTFQLLIFVYCETFLIYFFYETKKKLTKEEYVFCKFCFYIL